MPEPNGVPAQLPIIPSQKNDHDLQPKTKPRERAEWSLNESVDRQSVFVPNPSDSSETEQARSDKMLKDVRSLLAKIPSATEEQLIEEFLALQVSGPTFSAPKRQLDQVVGLIFNKAVEEPKHCALIVTLCKKQVEMELKVNNKQSIFRDHLLSKVQDIFVCKTIDDILELIGKETDLYKKKELLGIWKSGGEKFRNIK